MGYQTDFVGKFSLNKQLTNEDKTFLEKFAETRRVARNIEGYGVEGEFYVDGNDYSDNNIIDSNRPPSTQPGLWCQWVPTEDGMGIEWDQGEKFYNYVEWLVYLVDNFLAPKDYVLNGEVEWYGEGREDTGTIVVKDNVVSID